VAEVSRERTDDTPIPNARQQAAGRRRNKIDTGVEVIAGIAAPKVRSPGRICNGLIRSTLLLARLPAFAIRHAACKTTM
jgi:hypothetical protein